VKASFIRINFSVSLIQLSRFIRMRPFFVLISPVIHSIAAIAVAITITVNELWSTFIRAERRHILSLRVVGTTESLLRIIIILLIILHILAWNVNTNVMRIVSPSLTLLVILMLEVFQVVAKNVYFLVGSL